MRTRIILDHEHPNRGTFSALKNTKAFLTEVPWVLLKIDSDATRVRALTPA